MRILMRPHSMQVEEKKEMLETIMLKLLRSEQEGTKKIKKYDEMSLKLIWLIGFLLGNRLPFSI